MISQLISLERELTGAGAKPEEARALAEFAITLHELKDRMPQFSPKHNPDRRRFNLRLPTLSLGLIGGILVGLMIVAVAQSAGPGNWLYPIKRTSETIALRFDPDYRGVMMMRRAQEVKQLVVKGARPKMVVALLQDYQTDVNHYRGENYAAFEYCQTSLQQAETIATGQTRQEIASTLARVAPVTQ